MSYSFISVSIAFLAAIILGLAEPSFDPKPMYDDLVSVRMIPYWFGLVLFGCGIAIVGSILRKSFTNSLSWWVLLASTGLVGGIKLLHLWEGYHLLPDPTGYFGMSNLYEVTLLLGWLLGVVGLFFSKRSPVLHLPLTLLLLANASLSLWLHSLGVAGPQPLIPALQSYWLPWHVLANFIAYACFLVAGCAGMVVLISKKPAAQQAAALVITRAISVGFPLFTIAVVLGAAWAAEAWGGYWSWDPKETWALITWLVYAGYLHSRHTPHFTAKKQAWWAVIGFVATLVCYLGVNLFMNGLHSYGKLAG